jgi:DNA-binding NarL/FixJ family response regulator
VAAEGAWWNLFTGLSLLVDCVRSDDLLVLVVCASRTGRTLAAPIPERQLTVLERTARGESGTSLAIDLGISQPALSELLKRALRRIGLRSRTELIWSCREHDGLGPPGGLRAARFRTQISEWVVLTSRTGPTDLEGPFTPAERALLRGIVEGRSNKDIARARGTSPSTVAKQMALLCEKVGASSRYELVLRSQAFGPSPPGPDALPPALVQRLAERTILPR